MEKYYTRTKAVEVIQLNKKNLMEVLAFVRSPCTIRNFKSYFSDKCGEDSPYLDLKFTYAGKELQVCHGDYIVKYNKVKIEVFDPEEFAENFDKVSA